MPKPTAYPQVPLTKLKLDKKVKALVPRPSKEDRAALKVGLKEKGQKKPVTVLSDWTLVDGYTRYELLKELGVKKIKYEVVGGLADPLDLREYALDVNFRRRQLTDPQRVEIGVSYKALEKDRAKQRQAAGQKKGGKTAGRGRPKKPVASGASGSSEPEAKKKEKRARDEIGKKVGLSGTKFEKGEKVRQNRPDAWEEVKAGKKTINQAYNEVRREEKAKEAAKKAAKLKPEDLGGKVVHANAFTMEVEHPGTVDLAIVDPPYGIAHEGKGIKQDGVMVSVSEALAEWGLAEGAKMIGDCLALIEKLLRPGGSFYLFLDRLLVTTAWDATIQLGLKPRNTVYWGKTNPTPSGRGNWSSAIEAMIYGIKPGKKHTWNLPGDAPNLILTPVVAGKERTVHKTQKPVKLYTKLIEASSNPGDLVCDFMAGSGTCGVAAKQLKRRFILVERKKIHVDIIKTRLCAK